MKKELPESNSLLEPNESFTQADQSIASGEIVLGSFIGLSSDGRARVSFSFGNRQYSDRIAKSTLIVNSSHVGRQVALLFLDQDLNQPVIAGFIHGELQFSLAEKPENTGDSELFPEAENSQLSVCVDSGADEKLHIEGKDEVVLRCGEASITLTRQGKLILRGKYILSRSSGVNRILGGSVQVN